MELLRPRPVVAVIGGGQLARMMSQSATALGVELRPLVEDLQGSAGRVAAGARAGLPGDSDAVRALINGASVLTFEHEHIPADILTQCEGEIRVEPPAAALLYAQDKLAMRQRLTELGVPCPRWAQVETADDIDTFGREVGYPIVVKTPRGGYDGHGVRIISSAAEVADWCERGPLLAEECVNFHLEIAALTARRPSGEVASWAVATTEQRDGVCSVVMAPAIGIAPETAQRATRIAEDIARELGVTGVLAVEMFVVATDAGEQLFVNELAMRPHNTGHWTIDGAVTSQFEQHLRAVLDLPLGSTQLREAGSTSVMVNLLGSAFEDPAMVLPQALAGYPTAKVHLYGKQVRPGRKLGHVTVVDKDPEKARRAALAVTAILRGDKLADN